MYVFKGSNIKTFRPEKIIVNQGAVEFRNGFKWMRDVNVTLNDMTYFVSLYGISFFCLYTTTKLHLIMSLTCNKRIQHKIINSDKFTTLLSVIVTRYLWVAVHLSCITRFVFLINRFLSTCPSNALQTAVISNVFLKSTTNRIRASLWCMRYYFLDI